MILAALPADRLPISRFVVTHTAKAGVDVDATQGPDQPSVEAQAGKEIHRFVERHGTAARHRVRDPLRPRRFAENPAG